MLKEVIKIIISGDAFVALADLLIKNGYETNKIEEQVLQDFHFEDYHYYRRKGISFSIIVRKRIFEFEKNFISFFILQLKLNHDK